MSYDPTDQRIKQGGVVILDGAMGTEVQRRGGPLSGYGWSSIANLEAPKLVRQIHQDYIAAGADVITTNTFAADRTNLTRANLEGRLVQINKQAVRLAQDAIESAGLDRPVAIAAPSLPSAAPTARVIRRTAIVVMPPSLNRPISWRRLAWT